MRYLVLRTTDEDRHKLYDEGYDEPPVSLCRFGDTEADYVVWADLTEDKYDSLVAGESEARLLRDVIATVYKGALLTLRENGELTRAAQKCAGLNSQIMQMNLETENRVLQLVVDGIEICLREIGLGEITEKAKEEIEKEVQ